MVPTEKHQPPRLLDPENSDPHLYRRQFVAGPKALAVPGNWAHVRFGEWLEVYWHPELAASHANVGNSEILVLGDAFDPTEPQANDQAIAHSIAQSAVSFPSFETAIADLSGRFLLFVRIDKDARIYPDAAGLQSLYFLSSGREEGIVGSQPRLICEFADIRWRDEISKLKNPGYFAFGLTPYADIRPLLPNHYLDLSKGLPVRFWPKRQLTPLDLPKAAQEMSRLLVGTVSAIAARGRSFLPLTGGRDSRMLLAAHLAADIAPETGSLWWPGADRFDASIPATLSGRLGFRYRKMKIASPTSYLLGTYRINTGGMFWDPSSITIETFRRRLSGYDFIVSGVAAEVFRTFYHPKKRSLAAASPETICNSMRFEQSPLILKEIDIWLSEIRTIEHAINPWDMLYWEQRLGNWCSLSLTGRDTVSRIAAPFNNRRLLEIGLRAPAEGRTPPYELVNQICEVLCPAVLSEPFNTSQFDRTMRYIWPKLPYKLRRAWEVGSWAIHGLSQARRVREAGRRLH